jgi:hypothetical protein
LGSLFLNHILRTNVRKDGYFYFSKHINSTFSLSQEKHEEHPASKGRSNLALKKALSLLLFQSSKVELKNRILQKK